jgi:hypothetical protein
VKILFIGVFDHDREGRSANISQILAFKSLGHEVIGYNYRRRASLLGTKERDKELVSLIKNRRFDLVVYSKCNGISPDCCAEINKLAPTCLWWMDPLSTLRQHPDIIERAKIVDYVCTGARVTMPLFEAGNSNVYFVAEGFDPFIDRPHDLKKDIDVVFIGSLHSNRQQWLQEIKFPVTHIQNAFGIEHAKVISRSKICLNLSTTGAASDRVFKTLGAKGFLLSSDWDNRVADCNFIDGEDLVIFKEAAELNKKIDFYLKNDNKREKISYSGFTKVQNFTQVEWAKKIINHYKPRT